MGLRQVAALPLEDHLTASRVARIIGKTTNGLAKLRCAGKGPKGWFRVGHRTVLYPISEVREYLAELKSKGTP